LVLSEGSIYHDLLRSKPKHYGHSWLWRNSTMRI